MIGTLNSLTIAEPVACRYLKFLLETPSLMVTLVFSATRKRVGRFHLLISSRIAAVTSRDCVLQMSCTSWNSLYIPNTSKSDLWCFWFARKEYNQCTFLVVSPYVWHGMIWQCQILSAPAFLLALTRCYLRLLALFLLVFFYYLWKEKQIIAIT